MNIFAFTETHHSNPGYISINEDGDTISVSVRTRTAQSASTVTMTREQLVEMAQSILAKGVPPVATTAAPEPEATTTVAPEPEPEAEETTTTAAPEFRRDQKPNRK